MCVCLAGKASKGSDLSAAFIQVVHLGGITNLFDKPMWITPADEGFFRPIEISAMLSCSLFKTDAAQKNGFLDSLRHGNGHSPTEYNCNHKIF